MITKIIIIIIIIIHIRPPDEYRSAPSKSSTTTRARPRSTASTRGIPSAPAGRPPPSPPAAPAAARRARETYLAGRQVAGQISGLTAGQSPAIPRVKSLVSPRAQTRVGSGGGAGAAHSVRRGRNDSPRRSLAEFGRSNAGQPLVKHGSEPMGQTLVKRWAAQSVRGKNARLRARADVERSNLGQPLVKHGSNPGQTNMGHTLIQRTRCAGRTPSCGRA